MSIGIHAQSASTDSVATSTLQTKSAAKSQTSGGEFGPVKLPEDFSKLRVGAGDLLSVDIYETPEFTGQYRVDPNGDIAVPLIGKRHVAGMTQAEIATMLEQTLRSEQILVNPQVNVDISQYASRFVTVLGEVSNPGRFPVIGPAHLTDILAQAGGVTPLAGADVRIRHDGQPLGSETVVFYSRRTSNEATGQTEISPGDIIVIPRAGIIYVLGAVNHPGGYVMQEDGSLNVAQALSLAGGTALQAKTGGLRVVRRNADGTIADIRLSYDQIADGKQEPIALKAEDVVYVPMSKLKASFVAASSILSSAASATIVAAR
ncbi:MAG: polysaccharide export protein [Acidobacteriaceae bacterium]|nr:polysaccharide export protein [Acidobacteriaceae bacterium]